VLVKTGTAATSTKAAAPIKTRTRLSARSAEALRQPMTASNFQCFLIGLEDQKFRCQISFESHRDSVSQEAI